MKNRKNSFADLDRKRPTFFLLGLILILLAVYGLFNLRTYSEQNPGFGSITISEPEGEPVVVTWQKPLQEPEKLETKKLEKKVISDIFITIPDGSEIPEQGLFPDEALQEIETFGEEVVLEIDVLSLNKKPVFPGCEEILSEDERFECFKQKMAQFIGANLSPCEGVFGVTKEKLYVQFVVDENGHAIDAEAIRGNDVCNIDKAEAVIESLPKMKPGEAMGKKVRSRFVIPISIK